MHTNTSRIAIISSKRTPFTKMGTLLRSFSAIELCKAPVNALSDEFNLASNSDGLAVFGSVIQHSDVSNLAREVILESKLHPQTRAHSSIMACATSLSTIIDAALYLKHHPSTPWAIAGGAESMSNFPVSFSDRFGQFLGDLQFAKNNSAKLKALFSLRPSDLKPQVPPVAERLTKLSMGEHCELMINDWKIAREDQDKWAVQTQTRAHANKKFHESFHVDKKYLNLSPSQKQYTDNLIRETSLEKVSKLKPAFGKNGTITAASASPLTDGASAVLLATEEYAKKMGWPILAFIDDFEIAAVDIKTEGLLMAPPYAILRLLKRQKDGLNSLDRFDILEIHEAFAGQVLCNLKALTDEQFCKNRVGLAPTQVPGADRINLKGGSIALGHPFGATGARLIGALAQDLKDQKLNTGLISVCAAGGLGFVCTLSRA